MPNPNFTLLEQQDFFDIKPLNPKAMTVFRVKQTLADGITVVDRVVKVYREPANFFSLKQQKLFHARLLRSDGFARLHEVRKLGVHYLYVFEFVAKKNLLQRVQKKGVFSSLQAKRFLQQVLPALEALQAQKKIHGRLHPQHWVVNKRLGCLVGTGQLLNIESGYEHEVMPNDYMDWLYTSPERLDGQLSFASDIYALGLCLYFVLSGKHLIESLWEQEEHKKTKTAAKSPFKSPLSFWQVAWTHQHLSLPKDSVLEKEWQDLLRWMLQPEPSLRPTTEQLVLWLQDANMIQAVSLSNLSEFSIPVKSNDDDLITALADRHRLFATYQTAQNALTAGNEVLAFSAFENGIFKQYTHSEVAVGEMYQQGKVVKKSFAHAALNYYHAFQKGNPKGAFALACLMEEGKGLPQNLTHAEVLYRFAAVRGFLAAQTALGKFYAQKTDHRSLTKARYWLVLAVMRGDYDAQETLNDVLVAEMSQGFAPFAHRLESSLNSDMLSAQEGSENHDKVEFVADPNKVLESISDLSRSIDKLLDDLPH